MVPKLVKLIVFPLGSFRAVLFRMVPKQEVDFIGQYSGFRAVLFRMVPKPNDFSQWRKIRF